MDATFDQADDGRVAPALALALGARIVRGRGRNGYARAEVVQRGEEVLATVLGGSSRAGEVHVTITGSACPEVVPVLRRLWPDHRVSRADSALDFVADFERLDAVAVAFAERRGLKHSLITNSDGGATRYVGAASSEGRLRLYKKSEQLLALHPDAAPTIPPGIVRAEYVARPGKRPAKESVARMAPDDLWGLTEWGQEFAETVLGVQAERTATHFRRPSDWARSAHFLGVQYGPLVQERAGDTSAVAAASEVLVLLGFAGLRVVPEGAGS